jgi:hypothetical protein
MVTHVSCAVNRASDVLCGRLDGRLATASLSRERPIVGDDTRAASVVAAHYRDFPLLT